MRKSRVILGGCTTLALASLVLTGLANADTSTSSASVGKVAPRLLEKIGLELTGVYHGSSINRPFETHIPDAGTGELGEDVISTENYVDVMYKFTPSTKIKLSQRFDVAPRTAKDDAFTLGDTELKLSNSKLAQLGEIGFTGEVKAIIPTGEKSREVGRIGGIGVKSIASYEFPKSRWSLSLEVSAKAQTYSEIHNSKDFSVYAGPSVNYQILPNLSAGLLYELNAAHRQEESFGLSSTGTDLEPNFSWDITPRVNFSGYVDLKTSDRIMLNNSELGLLLTLKVL